MKYSLAMLRPPAMAAALSTMNSLLCMRRSMRVTSKLSPAPIRRVIPMSRPPANGLKSRTSTLGRLAKVRQQPVLAGLVQVVEQHSDAHTASCRSTQGLQKSAPGVVAGEDVVLHIDGLYCALSQLDAGRERVGGDRQNPEPRSIVVCQLALGDLTERLFRSSDRWQTSRAMLG